MNSHVNNLIVEYFEYHGLLTTAASFRTEALERLNITISAPASSDRDTSSQALLVRASHGLQLLRLFDEGNASETQTLWARYFHADVLQDANVLQFEFYLQLYFAIFPLLHAASSKITQSSTPKRKDIPPSFMRFKGFLETRGVSLANTPEFLPYYALPFIPDPELHPSFKPLFKPDWTANLRGRYEAFLSATLSALPVPRLCRLLSGPSSPQHLGSTSKASLSVTTTKSALPLNAHSARPAAAQSYDVQPGPQIPITPPIIMRDLDFSRLKAELISCIASKKCIILQALRFKLNQTELYHDRLDILKCWIEHDLLSCRVAASLSKSISTASMLPPSSPSPDFMSSLILSESSALRESICRLLNAIASYIIGREYLSFHPRFIRLLFSVLKTESVDNFIRQNALGILQKCSLRRRAQSEMVRIGLMEFICNDVLASHCSNSSSQYSLQYGSALLMNLALRSIGRRRSESFNILPSLVHMLENENEQIRTYINGTLYSILSLPTLRRTAKSIGLDETLSMLVKRASGQFESQLVYIIEQMSSEIDPEDSDDDTVSISPQAEEFEKDVQGEASEDVEIEDDQDELAGSSLDRPDIARFDNLLVMFLRSKQLPSVSSFNSNPGNGARPAPISSSRRAHHHSTSSAEVDDVDTGAVSKTGSTVPSRLTRNDATMSNRVQPDHSHHEIPAAITPVADAFMGRPRIPRTPTTVNVFATDSEFDVLPPSHGADVLGFQSASKPPRPHAGVSEVRRNATRGVSSQTVRRSNAGSGINKNSVPSFL